MWYAKYAHGPFKGKYLHKNLKRHFFARTTKHAHIFDSRKWAYQYRDYVFLNFGERYIITSK